MRINVTTTVAKVLRVFVQDPQKPRYGMEIMQAAHLASGSLYPILARLEKARWIVGHTEDIDPSTAGRPARRHYTMTGDGLAAARLALAELHELTRISEPLPGTWLPGPHTEGESK
ncbi:PadR family transcriptional regulator [Embleya scabrispora]|uniref:PadR family transcriptional regulator n=1 Tax=Embleya scabrispora TaxID=159449 RepID=UPI001F2E645B|nr:helix-turn-helix transcriptional regulator [Embleya scabrispora]